uniref:Uncharacterized protein n=1 Tax=Cacopsylla melanoneura TaxID=428564 RepID=A0A8D8TUU0_9HEMI
MSYPEATSVPARLITCDTFVLFPQALQSQLDSSPRTHQPALESLDSSSVFFLAYTQSQCKVTSHQQNELLSILGDLSDTTLLKTILSQSKEFSDTFSCSTKTENICPLII